MNAPHALARNMRAFVGVIRIITLVGLLLTPILLAPIPAIETKGSVSFVTTPPHLNVVNDMAAYGTRVVFKTLTAEAMIFPSELMPPDFLALRRKTMVPTTFARILVWFLISHFLWQLLCRLEKGEVFSASNLQLIRRIGGAIIAGAFIEAAAKVWSDLQFGEFIKHHVQIAGLTVQHNALSNFDIRFFITGCIVLVIAEAFRQGLALKQEADLTV